MEDLKAIEEYPLEHFSCRQVVFDCYEDELLLQVESYMKNNDFEYSVAKGKYKVIATIGNEQG